MANAMLMRSKATKMARFMKALALPARTTTIHCRRGTSRQATIGRPRRAMSSRNAARTTAPIAARQATNVSGVMPSP